MDVIDIQRKAKDDDKKTILIFNPLKSDFQGKWDGKLQEIIPAGENKAFKTSLAKHLGNQIVDLYIADKKNYPRERAKKLVFPND